jgi:hypothetical protein
MRGARSGFEWVAETSDDTVGSQKDCRWKMPPRRRVSPMNIVNSYYIDVHYVNNVLIVFYGVVKMMIATRSYELVRVVLNSQSVLVGSGISKCIFSLPDSRSCAYSASLKNKWVCSSVVEQETLNLLVEGSTPSEPTIFDASASKIPCAKRNKYQ